MVKKAVYAGSFDPVTKGHLDIIERSSKLADELIIAILNNSSKKTSWFTKEERVILIEESLKELNIDTKNIRIILFEGLLVDLIEKEDIDLSIRGLRAISDYEYEVQLNLTNELLTKKKFETIFLNSSRKYLYLSSSVVKEVALNKGEIKHFVTDYVKNIMIAKVDEMNGKK